jgi:hypothetical protein
MYPSDLFGNFYLARIDRFLDEYGVPSARYVDDIYIFLKNVNSSDHLLRELIPALRSYDLVINEAKASVMPKAALMTEEPDLETLFAAAIAEISSQIEDDEFDVDYGFQSDWEENETSDTEADDDLELGRKLINLVRGFPARASRDSSSQAGGLRWAAMS